LNNKITLNNGTLVAGGSGINISCLNDTLPSYLTLEDIDSQLSALVLNNAHMTIDGGYHTASERVYLSQLNATGSKTSSLTITNATFVSNNSFWYDNNSTGIVNILSGGFLIASNHFSVGDQRSTAVGIVNINGGDVYTHQANWVGNAYGATAYINLYDGSFTSSGGFELGHRIRAKAHVNISGGKFTANSSMYLGNYQADNAIGGTTGTVTLTGGELEVTGEMHLGRFTNCYGRVSIDGVSTSTLSSVKVGYGSKGYGEFYLTNGLVTLSADLEIGTRTDSEGLVTIDGGVFSNTTSNAQIGMKGKGSLIVNNGEMFINNELYAGRNSGSIGSVAINGGDLSCQNFVIGYENAATGSYSQLGGTVKTRGNSTLIADLAGSHGEFSVNGGTMEANGRVYVGNYGTGHLTLTGGETAFMNGFSIGANSSSTGFVTIAGGNFTNRTDSIIGVNGVGYMTISGGTNYITAKLTIGSSNEGTLNISGGETVITGERINSAISSSGTSRINISGGHLNIVNSPTTTGYLDIGGAGQCIMEMTGGLVETENLRISPGGGATPLVSKLIMNGGRLNVHSTSYLADTSTATGEVHLVDGVLSVKQLRGWHGHLEVFFDGGTLEARQGNSNFIYNNNGDGSPIYHILTARGLVVDSNDYNVGTPLSLPDAPGENGKLTKKGEGRFTISGTTTFTGPIAIEEGEVDLTSSGMVTLDGGVQIDGGAWLDLQARDQDFTMGAGSASRVDGTVEMASVRALIFPATSSLSGTGTLEHVTLQSGSTLVKNASSDESNLSIANLTIDSGANVELTGYTATEFEEGITFINGTSLNLANAYGLNFTLNGVGYDYVALTTTSDGAGSYNISAHSFTPGTMIMVR
jgi:autotransporter-associated beta strand protein